MTNRTTRRRDASIVLPARGRAAQTAALIPRLIMTAGRADWELIVVVDDDDEVAAAVRGANDLLLSRGRMPATIVILPERRGYWRALAHGAQIAQGRLLGNIANDILPGWAWLERAIAAYQRHFPDEDGVLAWNDGILMREHAGHLLIARRLLERWYGQACWPVWYDHLFGDAELCVRAAEQQRYAVALDAVLYHNHPMLGHESDAGYRAANAQIIADGQTFERRRGLQWPTAMTLS